MVCVINVRLKVRMGKSAIGLIPTELIAFTLLAKIVSALLVNLVTNQAYSVQNLKHSQ
jgi:hypothetical protein